SGQQRKESFMALLAGVLLEDSASSVFHGGWIPTEAPRKSRPARRPGPEWASGQSLAVVGSTHARFRPERFRPVRLPLNCSLFCDGTTRCMQQGNLLLLPTVPPCCDGYAAPVR